MKNNILRIMSPLILLMLVITILRMPYVETNSTALYQKQEQQALENYQKILKDRLAKEKIEKEKIYLTGKFDPKERKDFIQVPKEDVLGEGVMYLREETLGAFLQMQNSAKKGGIDLKVASATRNFNYQKDLWEKKWTGVTLVDGKDLLKSMPDELEKFKKILEYSAVPGTSRHHWGTDIDINDASPSYFDTKKGKKVYEWLIQNASFFGFCQTYNAKSPDRPTGYNEEKWHWTYLPLSRNFTKEYKNLIKDEDIKGFLGDANVSEQDLINNYVLSINKDCI